MEEKGRCEEEHKDGKTGGYIKRRGQRRGRLGKREGGRQNREIWRRIIKVRSEDGIQEKEDEGLGDELRQ